MPISQVVPLATSTQTNSAPASHPSTRPAPVRTITPPAPTVPPYTVSAAARASTRPRREVIRSVGSTARIASTGITYISAWAIPARRIAAGTSRAGSRISSAAELGSSTPTNEYSSTGTTATNTGAVGVRSPSRIPCTPCRAPYTATVAVKKTSSTI